MNTPIKIAIAEDNPFLARTVLDKLARFNDLQVKIQAEDGQDLLKQLEADHNVDVILMDIQMPNLNGIEATKQVKDRYPHIKVIMLTVFDDESNVFNSILAGANGYLLKDEPADRINSSLREILHEGAPMSPSIAAKALKLLRNPIPVQGGKEDFQLTPREKEVLVQLSKGLNYNQIADNLIVSPPTVRKHIENIYRKMQVHNKMEAVRLADQQGLL
jgi:DNA-binding NarL/FixJ family response regulator